MLEIFSLNTFFISKPVANSLAASTGLSLPKIVFTRRTIQPKVVYFLQPNKFDTIPHG